MKNIKIALLTTSILMVFVILSGCQHNNVSTIEEIDQSGKYYNELFQLELFSDKHTYKTTDNIKIWSTLKYRGNNDRVKIWHADPYISFYISDGKEFNIGGVVNTILASTLLEKDKVYKFDYVKSGGYSSDDPNHAFWEKFYKEKELHLPEGEYSIKVVGAFSLTEDSETGKNNLSKEIKIKVVK